MAERLLLFTGLAMVVVALVWRVRIARLSQEQMEVALQSPDPSVRTRALRRLATVGLRPYAPLVLRLAVAADGVRAAELAWVVAASQWEPADDPSLVQLRLWARDFQRDHGTRTPESLLLNSPTAEIVPPLAPRPASGPTPESGGSGAPPISPGRRSVAPSAEPASSPAGPGVAAGSLTVRPLNRWATALVGLPTATRR